MAWSGTNWVYDDINDLMVRNSTSGAHTLSLLNNNYEFKSNKTYIYKTKIHNLDDLSDDHDLTISTDTINFFAVNFVDSNTYSEATGYIYFKDTPNSNRTTNNWINYSAFENFTGINKVDFFELDWGINGLSWINNGSSFSTLESYTIEQLNNKYSPGWIYYDDNKSFIYLDTNNSDFYPIGGGNSNYLVQKPIYRKINCLYRYIEYEKFDLTFDIDISSNSTSNYGVTIYTSNEKPFLGINILDDLENIYNSKNIISNNTSWVNYINSCNLIGSYTQSSSNVSISGLNGGKYIFFVGDTVDTNDNYINLFSISNIQIKGGYNIEYNNKLVNTYDSDIQLDIEGATYSTIIGLSGSDSYYILKSRIGNGEFRSGIWENGVWNNGWRDDYSISEFYDIEQSVRIEKDTKWKIKISGSTSSVSNFNIGDKVSISNIIGIDMNGDRKLLKDYYIVVDKLESNISYNSSYLLLEINTSFPLRNIKIDSENHRIFISKNIWLFGVFLNGYYKGIWNNGLFKGYPLITEMEDTKWIDGIFDGGHFSTELYINADFTDTFYVDNGKLGLSFSTQHNLKIGDNFVIEVDNNYFGEYLVTGVINENQIKTNIDYEVLNGLTGSISTSYTTGLIQNMNFNSNNTSKVISGNSSVSSQVFNYNSWMDLVYFNDSAVNIGKNHNMLNNISKRYYSDNNLYGYVTNDILSSDSKFRDSYSLTNRNYKLGVKYKIFYDYIGESSTFNNYFSQDDINLFIERGWTYSVSTNSYATFSRTDMSELGSQLEGNELKVITNKDGVYLDIYNTNTRIFDRYKQDIEDNRYSLIEFDLMKYEGSYSYYGLTVSSSEPVINFNNLNTSLEYLPIKENVNHILTNNRKKIEYFYNKKNLSFNFRGNGLLGENESTFIINNLKLYEVNMVPFFKYFTDENINKDIVIPYQAISPYIDYKSEDFNLLDNINIGIDSFGVEELKELYSGTGDDYILPDLVPDQWAKIDKKSNLSFF